MTITSLIEDANKAGLLGSAEVALRILPTLCLAKLIIEDSLHQMITRSSSPTVSLAESHRNGTSQSNCLAPERH